MANKFKAFKAPVLPKDVPLVQNDGLIYKCSGCGGPVPDGVWIFEKIEDGMVVGMTMKRGDDGPIVHQCGEVD